MNEGPHQPFQLNPEERDFATGASHLIPRALLLRNDPDHVEALVGLRLMNFVATLRRTIQGGRGDARLWPEFGYLKEIDSNTARALGEAIEKATTAERESEHPHTGKMQHNRRGMKQYAQAKKRADACVLSFTRLENLGKLRAMMIERLRLRTAGE